MNYAIDKINTLAGCDLLVASAQKKKTTLARRRRNLGEWIDTFHARIDQLNESLTEVRAALAAYALAYQAMPEGQYKLSMNVDIKRLELRLARLEKRALLYNVHNLLAKQLLYHKLEAQLEAIDSYTAVVENKKKALEESVLRVKYTAPAALALRPAVVRPKSRFEKMESKLIVQKMGSTFPETGGLIDRKQGLLTNLIRW